MKMKRYIPFIMVVGILAFGACKEKKESKDIITTKYVPKKPQAPIAMPVDTKTTHITWQDKPYTIQIDRVSDDRVFTKASFSSYIDDTFRNNGILAGIQYDEIGDRGLEFSVVVGMPDALDDVFVPLELVIDRQGAISISRDDDMDMLDYDDREGDFDEEGV